MTLDQSSLMRFPFEEHAWIKHICSASGTDAKRDKWKKRVETETEGA